MQLPTFSSIMASFWAKEVASFLVGARIQKVQQITPWAFTFQLHFHKTAHHAYSSWDEERDRLGLTDPHPQLLICLWAEMPFIAVLDRSVLKTLTALQPETKQTLSPTGILLRKHLEGMRIDAMSSQPGEPVVQFLLSGNDELGQPVSWRLMAELIKKYANLVLVDPVDESIVTVAKNVDEAKSRLRTLLPGLQYAPPPKPPNKRILVEQPLPVLENTLAHALEGLPQNKWLATIQQQFWGFSRQEWQDLFEGEPPLQTPLELAKRLFEMQSVESLVAWRDTQQALRVWPKAWEFPDGSDLQRSLQEGLVKTFVPVLLEQQLAQRQQQYASILTTAQSRLQTRVDQLCTVDVETIQHYQQLGDAWLLEHAMQQTPDTETLMNPLRSLVENAQLAFQKAKKLKAQLQLAEAQQDELKEQLAYLEELILWVSLADTPETILALKENLVQSGLLKASGTTIKGKGKAKPQKPSEYTGILSLTTEEGYPLLIGKTAQANANIYQLSKPSDCWFHVENRPGAHVLIQNNKGPVSNNTILQSCQWAVYYSGDRNGTHVPVIYTEARFVRKIPNSYPGHVTYKNTQTALITLPDEFRTKLIHLTP